MQYLYDSVPFLYREREFEKMLLNSVISAQLLINKSSLLLVFFTKSKSTHTWARSIFVRYRTSLFADYLIYFLLRLLQLMSSDFSVGVSIAYLIFKSPSPASALKLDKTSSDDLWDLTYSQLHESRSRTVHSFIDYSGSHRKIRVRGG